MTETRREYIQYFVILSGTLFSCLIFFFTFFLESACQAQPVIDRLEQLWQEDQLEELLDDLPEAVRDYPENPIVLYFQGIFERDGERALKYFEKIVSQYPDSKFADDALFRMGQFYYTRNAYSRSCRYFSYFMKAYLNSLLYDDAYYLYCQSLLAQGKIDSARAALQAFIREARNSPYVDLAVLDLEFSVSKVEHQSDALAEDSRLPASKYRYTLQLGAFKNKNNAQKLVNRLKKNDLLAKIEKVRRGSGVLYAVWLGRFETKELARNFAGKHKQIIGNDYRIVNFNKR